MKTRIGISAGAFAAFTYLLCVYNGSFIPLVIAAGYVLLFERNEWLRVSVVKAIALEICFCLLTTFIRFIPGFLSWINSFIGLLDIYVDFSKVRTVFSMIETVVELGRTVIFLILALLALKMSTINFGFIDRFAAKHLSLGSDQQQ